MPMGCEASKEAIKLYANMADLVLAMRYIENWEKVGGPHPQRRVIELALNLMCPVYRERIEHDVYNTELFVQCNIGPEGVEHAIRLARALVEIFGIADEPRRSMSL